MSRVASPGVFFARGLEKTKYRDTVAVASIVRSTVSTTMAVGRRSVVVLGLGMHAAFSVHYTTTMLLLVLLFLRSQVFMICIYIILVVS